MDTQKIALLPVPHSGAFPVNSNLPIPVIGSVTLAAQTIGLVKVDKFAACKVQFVSIERSMTIQAPAVLRIVIENYVCVIFLKLPAKIVRLALFVARSAGVIVGGKRRRRRLNPFCYRRRFIGNVHGVGPDHQGANTNQ